MSPLCMCATMNVTGQYLQGTYRVDALQCCLVRVNNGGSKDKGEGGWVKHGSHRDQSGIIVDDSDVTSESSTIMPLWPKVAETQKRTDTNLLNHRGWQTRVAETFKTRISCLWDSLRTYTVGYTVSRCTCCQVTFSLFVYHNNITDTTNIAVGISLS